MKYQDKERRAIEFSFSSGSAPPFYTCSSVSPPTPHHYSWFRVWPCGVRMRSTQTSSPFHPPFAQSCFFFCFPFHSSSPHHKQSATPNPIATATRSQSKTTKNWVHRSARKSIAPRTPFLIPVQGRFLIPSLVFDRVPSSSPCHVML